MRRHSATKTRCRRPAAAAITKNKAHTRCHRRRRRRPEIGTRFFAPICRTWIHLAFPLVHTTRVRLLNKRAGKALEIDFRKNRDNIHYTY